MATWVGLRNFPEVNFVALNEDEHREYMNLIADKIEHAPDESSYATRQNIVLVVNDAGTGFITADQATHVDFASKVVREFKPHVLAPTGDVVLTDNLHGGGVVCFGNSSPATFTVAVSGDPATGVSSPFRCEIRNHGTSTVSLVLGGGLTNKNPASHTKVQANRGATILLVGTNVWFDGYTSA
jgi:hypothetical protein